MESPLQELRARGVATHDEIFRQKVAERSRLVDSQSKEYWDNLRVMLEKVRSREPLFRLSDVRRAEEELRDAAERRREEMREDERKRWAHIADVERSVLNRPLLMEVSQPGGAKGITR